MKVKALLLSFVTLALFFQTNLQADTKTLFTAENIVEAENYREYSPYLWDKYLAKDKLLYLTKYVLVEYDNGHRRLYLNFYEIDKAKAAEELGKDDADASDVAKFAKEKKADYRYGNVVNDGYSKSGGKLYTALVKFAGKKYELKIFQKNNRITAEYDHTAFYDRMFNTKVESRDLWKATKPIKLEFVQKLSAPDRELIDRIDEAFGESGSSLVWDHDIPRELDNLDWGSRLLSSDQRKTVYSHFDNVKEFFKEEIDDVKWIEDVNKASYWFLRRGDDKVVAIVGLFGTEFRDYADCAAAALIPVGKSKKSDYILLESDCD